MDRKQRDPLAWEEIRTEHVVKDEWIDFKKSAYRFPDGSVFEPYYSYSRKNYVVIVATDTDGNYLCVRQFRQGISKVTTEFPAGAIEWGELEDALIAAKRELREETGYESDEWTPLQIVASNATLADNYAYLYAAKNCRKVSAQDLDDTEFLHVGLYSAGELEKMIRSGDFEQIVHIAAWFLSRE